MIRRSWTQRGGKTGKGWKKRRGGRNSFSSRKRDANWASGSGAGSSRRSGQRS